MKVIVTSADFDCTARIVCRDKGELANHLDGLLDGLDFDYLSSGDQLTFTVKEMSQEELDNLKEFDGC